MPQKYPLLRPDVLLPRAMQHIKPTSNPQLKMKITHLLHPINEYISKLSSRWVRAFSPYSSHHRQSHVFLCSQPYLMLEHPHTSITTCHHIQCPLTCLLGSSDTAITIIFGVLGIIINILGILIAYLTLRAMAVENHTSQPSRMFTKHQPNFKIQRFDKFIVAEGPRPQQLLHVHKHTHTFNRTDAEEDIVRRGVGQYWWEKS